jgi:hypothetical protein
MVLVERLLDVARVTPAQRIAFYRRGYAWALENGDWSDSELGTLAEKYRALAPGLERLFASDPPLPAAHLWGGEGAAATGARFLADAQPVVDAILAGHASGAIRQDLIYLFWSYAHMFTNRMGVEAIPEAILRFFMWRFHQEHEPAHP